MSDKVDDTPVRVEDMGSPEVPEDNLNDMLDEEPAPQSDPEPPGASGKDPEPPAEPASPEPVVEAPAQPVTSAPQGTPPPEPATPSPEGPEPSVEDTLRLQINNLAGVLQRHGINPYEVVQQEPQVQQPVQQPVQMPLPFPQQQVPQPQPQPQPMQTTFIASQDEYNQMFEKPEVLESVLGRVAQQSAQAAERTLAGHIASAVQMQVALMGAVQEFYQVHRDLAPHKQFVSLVTQEVIRNNPQSDLTTVFQKTAEEARKRLGIRTPGVQPPQQQPPQQRRPGIPTAVAPARPVAPPQVDGIQKELDDLLPE